MGGAGQSGLASVRWLAALVTIVAVAIVTAPDGPNAARARTAARTPIEQRTALRPGLQLAAMRAAIAAAPTFYSGANSQCARVVPVIAYVANNVMAGNFRDTSGACYVWLNLAQSPLFNAQEICKTTLHEMGHLAGLQHSSDAENVMYSPFRSDPVPEPCEEPLP